MDDTPDIKRLHKFRALRARIAVLEGALHKIDDTTLDPTLGTPWRSTINLICNAALANDGTGVAAVLRLAESAPGWCGVCGGSGALHTVDMTAAANCPVCTPLRTALAAMEAGDAE